MTRSETFSERLAGMAGDLACLVEMLLPGRSNAMVRFRRQVVDFCQDPLARTLFLRGPIGSGKSTLARIIALLRYLSLLPVTNQKGILEPVRFDGPMRIDKRCLPWYEELSLTGLTESLADTQLFGVAVGAFTGARARMGLFEAAAKGHDPQGPSSDGATITGGVVLLDEVGDLPSTLQPKLLMVLTGAEVFRVGGEADQKYGFSFRGTTIAATWRDPTALLRTDVISRLSEYQIKIPSLEDRTEDFPMLVALVVDDLNRGLVEEIRRLRRVPLIDRGKLDLLAQRELRLEEGHIGMLARHPWSRSGELRGLRQVLQRMSKGMPLEDALECHQLLSPENASDASLDGIAAAMLSLLSPIRGGSPGFVEHVKEVERRVRARISELLAKQPEQLELVARRIGMNPSRLREQLADLRRVRKAEGEKI